MLAILIGSVIGYSCNADVAASQLEEELLAFLQGQAAAEYPEVAAEDRIINIRLSSDNLARWQCDVAIEFSVQGTLKVGSNTVAGRCATPAWQLYAPTFLSVYKQVVTANTPLSRQNRIDPLQLSSQRMDLAELRTGFFIDPDELRGYEPRRTIKAGQVITPYMVMAPALIQRGDWVTILAGKPGLAISMKGQAMKDGKLGEQIAVKNLKSAAIIRAWVVKQGVVSTRVY